MLQLTDKTRVNAANALGRDSWSYHQSFEVQQKDVGYTKPNYLGFRHSSYEFKKSDIGKTITILTDNTQWNCWSFG